MKVLIGTPIHEVKNYAIERWLKNVSKLEYPADVLLVDNSPGLNYIEKIKGYCAKYEITHYKLKHFESNQGMMWEEKDKRIEKSQEIIRAELLSGDYDAWFSWECDQIIPANALNKLVKLMQSGNFMIVVHNAWCRVNPRINCTDFGVTLISRQCLEQYGSLLPFVSRTDYPDMPYELREGPECAFKNRVLKNGGNYIEVSGLIRPIYHLNS